MSDEKPDGWCAWHPEKGWESTTFDESEHECRYELSPVPDANLFGYRIRPVYLVDASPTSEEVVVPRRLIERLEDYAAPFSEEERELHEIVKQIRGKK